MTTTMADQSQQPTTGGAPQAGGPETTTHRQALPWLGVILVAALALRGLGLTGPLQLDEFRHVGAVVERQGLVSGHTASVNEPLKAVAGWEQVRERSVLPFGIPNPVPLYNYLLYLVVQYFPITEWTLRLPSLLAGLGCVLGMFWICRRLLGDQVALLAATLVAVDGMQVSVSILAEPYALGNLACILTFAGLLWLWHGPAGKAVLGAVLYGLALALIGYLNPVLLFVLTAHLGLVVFGLFSPEVRPHHRGLLLGGWLAGCALAAALLWPEVGYMRAVTTFATAHREYLFQVMPARLVTLVLQNSTFLIGLLVVGIVGYVVRELQGSGGAPGEEGGKPTPAPAEPLPDNQEAVWTGRLWLFLPQLVVLVVAYAGQLPIFQSRFLSYTALGGILLLAYLGTRERSRDGRLGVMAALVLACLAWGYTTWSRGNLFDQPTNFQALLKEVQRLEELGRWKEGDVLLYHCDFPEADFLPGDVPEAQRDLVRKLLAAPFTTLYATANPQPLVLLSHSNHRGEHTGTWAGQFYKQKEAFYDPALSKQLQGYQRFWFCSNDLRSRRAFMMSFLPWLADELGWDLKVARRPYLPPEDPDRYFDVQTGIRPKDFISGLTDGQKMDFTYLVLVRRKQPPGVWAHAWGGLPTPYVTLPAWLALHLQTPRLTERPGEEVSRPGEAGKGR